MNFNNVRKYGDHPFKVAVIHGGPGVAGEMAPVALELSKFVGVLEPLQTVASLKGQVIELYKILKDNILMPVVLIGWSWGAWLSVLITSEYPLLVKELILVGSGPFEEKYTANIISTRLNRLNEKEKAELKSLQKQMCVPVNDFNNNLFARLGQLLIKTDSYELIPHKDETIEFNYEIYQKVWEEASALRKSGLLLNITKKIQCPVLAIHGDFDPHPSFGVKEPLSSVLNDFNFIELKQCGHLPWLERNARDEFFDILFNKII
jgi:pimeloyl-ACP methyl ester carboxylesterase